MYGATSTDMNGQVASFNWIPTIQTFPVLPRTTAPPPAGELPSPGEPVPMQEIIAGQTVRASMSLPYVFLTLPLQPAREVVVLAKERMAVYSNDNTLSVPKFVCHAENELGNLHIY